MKFEQINSNVIETRDSARFAEAELAAAGTTIETRYLGGWHTDGYDDKVPVPQTA
jgi:hypothetical protein